jgi:hypothetical protein|tara:strand:- start:1452 stop:2411 length:960 start_codon:yes stop_codon:yes gene_type:complete
VCRVFQVWLISAAVLSGAPGFAQSGKIPQAVIDECNAEAGASDLPDCLKNGAIAFEMLALARSEPFFGAAASRVIDPCREKNDTFHTTWICFENAAEKAVETRELIGRENIADACVAGISNPDVHAHLEAAYREKRDARFPDQMFFGGDMYSPFQGCPRDEAVMDADPVSEALADALGGSGVSTDARGDEACSAYGGLQRMIATSTVEELRAMPDQLEAMGEDKPDPKIVSRITGLPVEAVEFLYAKGDAEESQQRGMRTVALLGVFLRDSHPELLEEFFELTSRQADTDPDSFARQAAQAFFLTIMDAAEESYRQQCQ